MEVHVTSRRKTKTRIVTASSERLFLQIFIPCRVFAAIQQLIGMDIAAKKT